MAKIAIVPGSFKPPHKGHLAMVEQYSQNNDKIIILISNPLKDQRALEDGTVITAQNAIDMWVALASELSNVEIQVSPSASPVGASYNYIRPEGDLQEGDIITLVEIKTSPSASPVSAAYAHIGPEGDLQEGDIITLGASNKGTDIQRWKNADRYVKEGVTLLNPQTTAVQPEVHSTGYIQSLMSSDFKESMPSIVTNKDFTLFHASDMRYLLGKASTSPEAVKLLQDFVLDDAMAKKFLDILGITPVSSEPIGEISAMGAGPVAGYSKPFVGKRDEDYDCMSEQIYNIFLKRGILK